MKHLIVNNYGHFIGISERVVTVKKEGKTINSVALNRVKTIQVFSKGVSVSSDLVTACALRGVKIFFNTFDSFSALHASFEHKSVEVRKKQYLASQNMQGSELARRLIIGKLKNQRATLLYASRSFESDEKKQTITRLDTLIGQLKNKNDLGTEFIRGIEGAAAGCYFEYIKNNGLFGQSFEYRTKRHSQEISNIALNYGYAILFNFIYKACINAGLEPYMGVLHSTKSAKPSLVLDIMEEYRSFVVDRNIIKLRFKLNKAKSFHKVKKDVASQVLTTLGKKYKYNKKKLNLESIIQRQVYKISGFLCSQNGYKSYIFRW